MTDVSATRVLVTGGAGFIGSHLCDRLIQEGHYVVCVDNLITGRLANVRPLLNHPRFEFIEQDVIDPLKIPGNLGQIYNLACPASPQHYQRDPVATMKTCVIGAHNVLDLAREKNAVVMQASTSEVYGDPEIHPQSETYLGNVNAIGPRACYDEGKRCAETLFFDYHRRYGTQIKVARIFNTYGPRMLEDDGRVVSNFIVQALRNEPITLHGDGQQTRSFCYIDDLVDGLRLLMASSPRVTGPINLGNPEEVPIRHIAQLVLGHTGSSSTLEHRKLPEDDPKRRKPVILRARELLGWHPRITLEKGLRATIDYFSMALFTSSVESDLTQEEPIAIGSRRLKRQRSSVVRQNGRAMSVPQLN